MRRFLTTFRDRERFLRCALRLPAEAPDPVGFDLVPAESGYLSLERVSGDQLAERQQAWHEEDWHADAADFFARVPQRAKHAHMRAHAVWYAHRGARALTRARTLRYTSHYIHPERGCGDVEGYFDFGPDLGFPLQVVSSGQADRYARNEWGDGAFLSDTNNILGFGRHVIVGCDELTPELVAEAVERWYQERFEFHRGHWTHRERSVPVITVDLEWADEAAMNPAEQALRLGPAA